MSNIERRDDVLSLNGIFDDQGDPRTWNHGRGPINGGPPEVIAWMCCKPYIPGESEAQWLRRVITWAQTRLEELEARGE